MESREVSAHIRLRFASMAHHGGPDGPPQPHGRNGPGYQHGQHRRRLWKRLWIVTGSVAAACAVVACSSASSSHPSATISTTPPPSAKSLGPAPTPSAVSAAGPSACVTVGRVTGGSGPWKLVAPSTLCHLPLENSAQYQQSGQSLAQLTKVALNLANAGPVTSTIAVTYGNSGATSQYRSVYAVGFVGRFRPAAALGAVEEPGYSYATVPPGPHGGTLACADVEGSENCVWATPTTVCAITILDASGELIGANSAANAVRIRDVLEVPA
jgi:hypothetical protein